jgi:Flp pilus assembly pilin Flp
LARPSTPGGAEIGKRRGRRPFGRHDDEGAPSTRLNLSAICYSLIRPFRAEQSGVTAVEYGLIAALTTGVIVAIVALVTALDLKTTSTNPETRISTSHSGQ